MMKKKLILSFFFVALGFGVVKAQDLPDKKETLKTVTKVNDYFMKKYADYRTPSFVKNVTCRSNMPIILSPVFMVVYVPVISGHAEYIMKD